MDSPVRKVVSFFSILAILGVLAPAVQAYAITRPSIPTITMPKMPGGNPGTTPSQSSGGYGAGNNGGAHAGDGGSGGAGQNGGTVVTGDTTSNSSTVNVTNRTVVVVTIPRR